MTGFYPGGGGGGRGVMTLHDYGYLPLESSKELPCFGVKFSNIHPASESGFLSGIFWEESIVVQVSFVMLIFLLFSNQLFCRWGKFPGQIA